MLTTRIALLGLICTSLVSSVQACGPGRGHGRRRPPRKLTPLAYKQYIPNVAEKTLGASGRYEGKITRNSERFKELTPNYNPDIIFKDEEDSGADRLMTQVQQPGLMNLSSLGHVWKGLKIVLSQAFEEIGANSLPTLRSHKLSIEVSTSQRRRKKKTQAVQTAGEAGNRWMFRISLSRLHCGSCSKNSVAAKSGGCFPGSARVSVESGGTKLVKDLIAGDRILAANDQGDLVYSDFILFLDRAQEAKKVFYVVETQDPPRRLTLTAAHLVFVLQESSQGPNGFKPTFASNVTPGQVVYVVGDSQQLQTAVVERVYLEEMSGAYAPLTAQGNLVVDQVLASCYAVIEQHKLAHWAFTPVRLSHAISSLLLSTGQAAANSTDQEDGLHWYSRALYQLGGWVLDTDSVHPLGMELNSS
uniref:Hedgehog protein n=1 Tax=Callorhinchus milii TaxID=7868 RepID=A0A4W3I343_CALMI